MTSRRLARRSRAISARCRARSTPSTDIMAKREKYLQIHDGEWIGPAMRGFRHKCCGGALTHKTDYRIVNGKVQFRVVVDNRATADARRKFKFTKDED